MTVSVANRVIFIRNCSMLILHLLTCIIKWQRRGQLQCLSTVRYREIENIFYCISLVSLVGVNDCKSLRFSNHLTLTLPRNVIFYGWITFFKSIFFGNITSILSTLLTSYDKKLVCRICRMSRRKWGEYPQSQMREYFIVFCIKLRVEK